MTEFSEFAAGLRYTDIPAPMLALLRRSFLDTMGVAAIGQSTEMSAIARRTARAVFGTGGAGGARMLMDGGCVSPIGAAMAGAFTIDSIDAHDGTTPNKGHVGSAVFPSVLAVADVLIREGREVSGQNLAVWLAIGYEVASRAGQVQHATCADYHTSGSWTAVGVAAAVMRMLDGSPEQIRHAAGIAEFHGPRSQMMRCIDHPTMVRDGVGWGAPSGVTAAYLAREGFTGAPALTCEGPEAGVFWEGLGEEWLTVAHTHYKPYPCCRWAHPAIDAVRDMMASEGLHHSEVARVEIRTFHYATRLAGHEPKTLDEFSYAIAFPVAAMIVRGQIGPSELTPSTLMDPEILRVSRATELIDDAELTARSVAQRWAQVSLVLSDGRRIEDAARTPRGDVDAPLSDAEISEKFHLFADEALGEGRAARLEDLAARFDGLDAGGVREVLGVCLEGV